MNKQEKETAYKFFFSMSLGRKPLLSAGSSCGRTDLPLSGQEAGKSAGVNGKNGCEKGHFVWQKTIGAFRSLRKAGRHLCQNLYA